MTRSPLRDPSSRTHGLAGRESRDGWARGIPWTFVNCHTGVTMRLVERERECAAAQALIDAAAGGAGGLLVIEGPPGIGKSALLADLAGRAGAAGVAACSVRATRLGA